MMETQGIVYADNSATTPVSPAALEAMLPLFSTAYGNPSAIYGLGRDAKKSLEDSRRKVAGALGARNNEIFFTSGGTEGDNWAIFSVCEQYAGRGKHIISTRIEHSAVLKALERLEGRGFEVTLLEPGRNGMVSPDQLRGAIREDTILVSVMMANNVTGALLPIKGLCDVAHERKVLFHTDAVQAAGHIPINVRDIGVDMLTLSAHKFHGPKGIGALYARVPLIPGPLIWGGGQEKGRRSGTENVPLIAGMAAALEEGTASLEENNQRITALRDRLIAGVLAIPGALLTGDPVRRLPGLASFVFEGLEGVGSQKLVLRLDEEGICVSSGSACSVGSIDPPAPLLAMGYDAKIARSALRISLSVYNTEADVDRILEALPPIVEEARKGIKEE
ncbi:MAG: cysteine desulfurase [Spirochaetaceae bacterium]|jgi:cysteine desulfurase|nr:cysteine desulfurase [Spirochaetaceae bacterium]